MSKITNIMYKCRLFNKRTNHNTRLIETTTHWHEIPTHITQHRQYVQYTYFIRYLLSYKTCSKLVLHNYYPTLRQQRSRELGQPIILSAGMTKIGPRAPFGPDKPTCNVYDRIHTSFQIKTRVWWESHRLVINGFVLATDYIISDCECVRLP